TSCGGHDDQAVVVAVFWHKPRETCAMTSLDRIDTPPARPDGGEAVRGLLAAEFAETLKLATPIALTQLGQIAMMTTDLALIGRLGTDAVAAASLGQTVAFMGFVVGMGLVSAVAP